MRKREHKRHWGYGEDRIILYMGKFKNFPESAEITKTIEEKFQISYLLALLLDLAWIDSIIKANFF